MGLETKVVPEIDLAELTRRYDAGLNPSTVAGGALYAFHCTALQEVISRYRRILQKNQWPVTVDEYLERVELHYLPAKR